MEYKNNTKTVIKRYEAFWNKDKLDRIPIRIRFPVGSLQPYEFHHKQKLKINKSERWEDICVDPQKYFEYWNRQFKAAARLMDDSMPSAVVDFGPALMCGIMGAEIFFTSGTTWSKEPLHDWADLDKYNFNENNSWYRKVVETTNYFIKKNENKFLVGIPTIVGPADIITCLRGAGRVCLDLYEYPKEIHKLLKLSTETFIKFIDKLFNIIPRYYGGTSEGYMMMWTPGRGFWLSNDLSITFSPEHYREFFYKYEQQIVDHLDNCWMHVHSGAARMAEEFIKLDGLKGIQISNDRPAGPILKELLPIIKKIQEKHCLILRKYSIDEIKEVLPNLSPGGLFIDTQCDSFQEAENILGEWDILTRKK